LPALPSRTFRRRTGQQFRCLYGLSVAAQGQEQARFQTRVRMKLKLADRAGTDRKPAIVPLWNLAPRQPGVGRPSHRKADTRVTHGP